LFLPQHTHTGLAISQAPGGYPLMQALVEQAVAAGNPIVANTPAWVILKYCQDEVVAIFVMGRWFNITIGTHFALDQV